jgi:sigma-E factor negative regulatory protein RseB
VSGLPLILVCLGFLAAEAGASERSVAEQLQRMGAAMDGLSYEGTLVYLHDSRLETLHIVHRVDDGEVHEVLESLTGPVRTITRGPGQVTCHLADARPISVRRQGLGSGLFRSKAIDAEALAPYYLIHPLGSARVAGRDTDVVGVIPRDVLRYGYRFYLDRETGLPLKSDLMGTQAEPIEQIMFTSLALEAKPAAVAADAVSEPEDVEERSADPAAPDHWRFESLPAGFKLVLHDLGAEAGGHETEHFVVSDGLASVSVYMEKGVEDGLDGDSRMGAVHAAGARVAGHQVTVVGEVPPGTVAAVLAAVRYRGEGAP